MSLTIQWKIQESRTQTTGGDTTEVEIGEVAIDAVITETHNMTATPTTHPVERGSSITDHVRDELDVISLECAISNTPITATSPNMSIQNVALQVPKTPEMVSGAQGTERSKMQDQGGSINVKVLRSTLRFDRPMEVYDILRDLKKRGVPITLVGLRFGDFDEFLITSFSCPVDNHSGIQFTMDVQELRIVSTELVDAPSPQVERGRRRQNRGNQEASQRDTTARRQSALVQLADFLDSGISDIVSGARQ